MKRKDFLFSLIAAPVAFVAGVRSYRGVPPVVVPRSNFDGLNGSHWAQHFVAKPVDLFPSGPFPTFKGRGLKREMYFEWRTDR